MDALLVALAFAGTPVAVAVAQEDDEAIELSYRASEGCPGQAAFVSRVRARTTRARLVPPGTGAREARSFDVEVDAGHPALGRLTIGDPNHPEGTRRVQAETCGEVADALALVVALAIDPRTSPAVAALPSPPDEGSPPDAGGASNAPAATITADAYPIAPGQEAILCQTFSNPFGRDVDLVSIEATAQFAYDVFLFSLPPEGGVSRAPTALMGCLLDPLGSQPFLYFSNQPQFAMTYPQADMGYPLAAANSLMLRAHYLNAGATMGPGQTTLSLTAAIAGQVTEHVGAIFLSHSGFPVDSLADGGPLTDETSASPLGQAYNVFTSWNFAQPLKAEVSASANGTVFYGVTNLRTYSQLSEHSPPVQLGAGESITWSCTYPTEDLAMNGKCVYQGFYYPADPQNPDRTLYY